jgi:pimeloyl-ACP methyl ester carboxylesterase
LLLAVWQIAASARGLEIITLRSTTPPLTLIAPQGAGRGDRPLVLIGHGYAGSAVIMRGFALTLAHAGYSTVSWDLDGHGSNPQPLPSGSRDRLVINAQTALAEAVSRGWGDGDRFAIVGHSMGSGVALAFGQARPDTAATIAISPAGREITPNLPHNLLLMAGSLEPSFVRNAENRLAEAGGRGGSLAAGSAREMLVVPGVEHISVLFSPTAHAAARDWLDGTFGQQPNASPYTDQRVRWYGLGLVGGFLVAAGLGPLFARPSRPAPIRPLGWRLASLVGGPLASTLLLWGASIAGLELRTLLGLLVGGYIVIWFGLAGVVSHLLLWQRPSPRPSARALVGGLFGFGLLWLAVGLLGQEVWLPWLLIVRRLLLWPVAVLLLLPWFLVVGEGVQGARWPGKIGWWLVHSLVLCGSSYLGLRLSPDLGFIMLLLPLFPIMLALHGLTMAGQRESWAFGLSGAMFISWLLLAVFPLQ